MNARSLAPEETLRRYWNALKPRVSVFGRMVAFLICTILISGVVMAVVELLGIIDILTEQFTGVSDVGIQLFIQGVVFIVACAIYARQIPTSAWYAFRLHRPTLKDAAHIIGGTVLLIALLTATDVLAELVPFLSEPTSNTADTETLTPLQIVVVAIISLLIIAPGEELLFRGVIQTRLRGVFSTTQAIFLTSCLFALIHAPALIGSGVWLAVGFVFASGIVLGSVYELSQTLYAPIVIHGLYNSYVFLNLL